MAAPCLVTLSQRSLFTNVTATWVGHRIAESTALNKKKENDGTTLICVIYMQAATFVLSHTADYFQYFEVFRWSMSKSLVGAELEQMARCTFVFKRSKHK